MKHPPRRTVLTALAVGLALGWGVSWAADLLWPDRPLWTAVPTLALASLVGFLAGFAIQRDGARRGTYNMPQGRGRHD